MNEISNTIVKVKLRDSNLELYRIIVMFMIVAHHYVVNSGLIDVMKDNPTSSNSIFFYLFGMWGKTGINCFVMITGYFMCKSNITIRKFLKLVLEVIFYNAIIYLFFVSFGKSVFSFKDTFLCFLPIKSISVGFTSCFIAFYLAIPFLNILVRNMTKRQHQLLICLCLFIYTFIGMIPIFKLKMNYVSWFCVLYFIASYIRFYSNSNVNKTQKWEGYSILFIFLSLASVLMLLYISSLKDYLYNVYFFVSDTNKILALLTAVCTFMWFKNMKIKYSKWINTIASSMFGVLLIHANSDTMRHWLWKETLQNANHYTDNHYILYAVISVLTVFFICIIIDQIRIHTIEKYTFKQIDKILNKYSLNYDERKKYNRNVTITPQSR